MRRWLTGPVDATRAVWPALAGLGGAVTVLFATRLLAEETLTSWAWQPLAVGALALGAGIAAALAVLRLQGTHSPAPALVLLLPLLYLLRGPADPLAARLLVFAMVAVALLLALSAAHTWGWVARLGTAALLVLPFLAYLATLAPTVGQADSFEFQVTAARLGVAHPTGYPLYILLGRLFILLPIGSVAYRVNLTSAVFAALAVALLYRLVASLTGRREAALLAALAFAFSRTFWSQAVVAEVYTLNAFFVALVLNLVLAPDLTPAAPRWAPYVYGLSLTNHLTMVLLAPALLVYAVWGWLARDAAGEARAEPASLPARLSSALSVLAYLFLGLGVYLYLPLRWPALNQGQRMGVRRFLSWVTAQRFGDALRLDAWLRDPVRYRIVGRLILEQLGWVGVVLAALGLAWLLWRWRRLGIFLLLAWTAYAFYGLNYMVADVSVFIIPAHLLMAIGLGIALAAGLAWLEARSKALLAPALLLAALLPFNLGAANWPLVDQSRSGWEELRWGRRVLALDLPQGSAILADSLKIAPLVYLQTAEHVRPDLDIVVMGDEAGYRSEVDSRLSTGQHVYLARFLPGLEGRYHLRSLGPLVEVSATPLAAPPAVQHPLAARFGPSLTLLGYSTTGLDLAQGDGLALTLFWRAEGTVGGNYQVRLRLLGPGGHAWFDESVHPVAGAYPTGAWRPGEVVPDSHELTLGANLPPGDYRLQVGLALPFARQGLPVDGGPAEALDLATVHVRQGERSSENTPALPSPRRADFGGLQLVGADYPTVARPGSRLALTLYWRRLASCPDYEVLLEALDSSGQVVAREGGQSLYGEWPTSRWPEGRVIATTHQLLAPPAAGPLELRLALRDPAAARLQPVRPRWLASLCDWYALGATRLEGTPLVEGATNFGDRIYLTEQRLGRTKMRPGQSLKVALTWQCARRMQEDYTVFVHLLDSSGRVRGQVDVWPLQGTYPTSQWREGETVADTYTVRLDPGAPSGAYQVEVGWYLLATMERLPVLDQDLRPIENRVLIPGLKVVR